MPFILSEFFESMLRGLLRDSEAAKAFFEEFGLFKAPELLEKYVIASEVTVEVLDVFLSRVFGTERGSVAKGSGDLSALLASLGCVSSTDRRGGDLPARAGEPDKAPGDLRVRVQDIERQLCALQRHLKMQADVSQLVDSLDARLGEIARECDKRVSDVGSQVSAVSEGVANLQKEVRDRARTEDVRALSDAVSLLKKGEWKLGDRISGVERVVRDEVQGEIKRLDAAAKGATDALKRTGVTDYDSSKPLSGVIEYLTRVCGGNVHEKGFVEVTASSVYHGSYEPQNAVELGTKSFFISNGDKPGQWICYDFKGRRVAPTSYSIRTHDGNRFPRSWVLEVSNTGSEGSWTVVDTRENNGDLNAKHVTRNFAVKARQLGSFHFVRLHQTGKNAGGYDYLYLNSLELFGTLHQ